MRGLYVHVPFCIRKCGYCDFYSLAARDDSKAAYVGAVLREASASVGRSFNTLYLGGGTPSLLGPELLERLVSGLRSAFDLSALVEASMEVNPDSAYPDLLLAAGRIGFNRLSVGVQSLSDDELRSVGRIHTATQAIETIRHAQSLGFRSVSADLIAGLPGQTWPSLRHSLETLLDLGIDHVSLYCLSVEEGTPLAAAIPVDLPSDDLQAELFEQASSLLAGRGFAHYEISNFARPGHECLHNLVYWRGGEYLGLGPAAASHVGGKRFNNRADLDAYVLEPEGQREHVECLDQGAKAAEEAMLRLRLLGEGLDFEALEAKFGSGNVADLGDRLEGLVRGGMLERQGARHKLNPSRVLTSNPIFAEVLFRR
jgi:oxygen-independent coproporphyrinogen-3 oxidase